MVLCPSCRVPDFNNQCQSSGKKILLNKRIKKRPVLISSLLLCSALLCSANLSFGTLTYTHYYYIHQDITHS